MPADGSIIIDTRINNKGAEADLKLLQAKAKSTAQQISALDKQIASATNKRSKLAEDLEKARNAASATAQELDTVNTRLEEARNSKYGITSDKDVALSDKLAAALQEQDTKVAGIQRRYQAQLAELENLNVQHSKIREQLDKELSAARAAANAIAQAEDTRAAVRLHQQTAEYERQQQLAQTRAFQEAEITRQKQEQAAAEKRAAAFQSGNDAMQSYFSGMEAKVGAQADRRAASALKHIGVMDDGDYIARAENIIRETQREVAAQEKAAKAAEERAAREAQAAKKRSVAEEKANRKTDSDRRNKSAVSRIGAASSAVSRFGSRLMGIVSGALVFNIISAGLSRLTGWMGSALKSTDAFRQALANLQGAASTAAAPLVQALGSALSYVINLLATGISYLARFISLLTGKSISSMKAGAQAMNGYGNAASGTAAAVDKAAHSLAGFDEITRLDAPQQTSGGGGGSTGPDYDFVDSTAAGFERLMDKARAFWNEFRRLYGPSLDAWGKAWDQVRDKALEVWPRIQKAATNLQQNAIQPLTRYLVTEFAPGIANAWSQAFAPITGDVVSNALDNFTLLFETDCQILTDAVNQVVMPALQNYAYIWQDAMTRISAFWDQYGEPILSRISQAVQWISLLMSDCYYTIIEPILTHWNDNTRRLWDEAVGPFFDAFLEGQGLASIGILDLWNYGLAPFSDWMIRTFGPGLVDVVNGISDAMTNWLIGNTKVATQVRETFEKVVRWFVTDFGPAWTGFWDNVRDGFLSIWDTITGALRDAVNSIISRLNGLISAAGGAVNAIVDTLNGLSFSVPDWVPELGGQTFGFDLTHVSIPQIPYLAQGAVIPPNREFLAVLGDQSSGTNVEAPLSTIQQAVAAVMQDYQDGNLAALEQISGVLRRILEAVYGIHIGDDTIGRAAERYRNRKAVITGGV